MALPEESYARTASHVTRVVADAAGVRRTTVLPSGSVSDPAACFSQAWLASPTQPDPPRSAREEALTTVDLFSGCGGLSLGVHEAGLALGLRPHVALAVDMNERALDVFEHNFRPDRTHSGRIEELCDGYPGEPLSLTEHRLRRDLDGVDLLIGGPPCQGNSDLNNHTRRDDPKNRLYLRMARFAEVIRPRLVLIENVPGVAHDRGSIVERTERALNELGYATTTGVMRADAVGAAQRRKRHFLLASLNPVASVSEIETAFATAPLSVDQALHRVSPSARGDAFDSSSRHSEVNRARIDFLFDHGLFELPDEQRPDCHRLKPHTYGSVYGRMHGDQPAPTITSGFGSTGQGRFVHPHERRTLTPHEAARLQGFPDFFDFTPAAAARRALQEMIGNAVPSRLGYVVAMGLLASR